MLIIGGLIALGIVALLGAFFLARGGGKENGSAPTEVDTPQASTQLTVPISASRPQPSQDGQATASQPLVQPFPLVQSREIEQRLQGISTVLDRLDQFDYPESPAEAFSTATIGNAPRLS